MYDFMLQKPSNKPKKETRIVVAMSGGVDSSVVAAMLKHSGYDVIGITLQLYDMGMDLAKSGACCAGQDIYDAKQVADSLSIPHYVLNYESKFKSAVIDDFADTYLKGQTPIPCVRCNQTVKFKDLLAFAKDLDADGLATGHYVQKKLGTHGFEMHTGNDLRKDQSYFLFTTTYPQLSFCDFPLGNLTKDETRELARKFSLKTAEKSDSQDICFVAGGSYRDFVSKMRPESMVPGKIIDIDGNHLADHNGIINFTIGQRKKIGIASPHPLYVLKIDAKNNEVFVGPESALYKTQFLLKDMNWINQTDENYEGKILNLKLRSSQQYVEGKILKQHKDETIVELIVSQKAITPGQACVFYDQTRMLGGGWIEQVL